MKKKELLLLLEKYKDNDNVDFTTIGDDADLIQLINMWYINKTKQPDLPIYIYNYTDMCQYQQKWNEHTITHRWLVKDEAWNIIARSFDKIFNYEELSWRKRRELIDWNTLFVQEKLDWSMLIAFPYEWQWITATRWSFTSEQAIEWMKILQEKHYFDHMDIKNTYVFEVIYPENRIVVNYGDERRCVLLQIFDEDQQPIGTSDYDKTVFDLPKKYWIWDMADLPMLIDQAPKWDEWFVCWTGRKLFKIKLKEYLELHRSKFNYNPQDIFDLIKSWKRDFSYLPDEYYPAIKKMIEYYDVEYQFIKNLCYNEYQQLWPDRRKYLDFPYASVIFAHIDFKDVSKYINSFIKLPPSLWTTQPE